MQISAVEIGAGDDTAQINCNPNMCVDTVDATGSDATFNQHFALNEPFDSQDDAVFASYSKSCATALNTF